MVILMLNFTKKVAKLEKEVSNYNMEDGSVINVPRDDLVRIMLEGGQMLEPCKITGESMCFLDFILFDLEEGPAISFCIEKTWIIGFGTFYKSIEELNISEEELNAVPASLYL